MRDSDTKRQNIEKNVLIGKAEEAHGANFDINLHSNDRSVDNLQTEIFFKFKHYWIVDHGKYNNTLIKISHEMPLKIRK